MSGNIGDETLLPRLLTKNRPKFPGLDKVILSDLRREPANSASPLFVAPNGVATRSLLAHKVDVSQV